MLPLTRTSLLALAIAASSSLDPLVASAFAQDDAEPAAEPVADETTGAEDQPAAPQLTFSDAPLEPELVALALDAARGDWNVRRAALAKLSKEYGGRSVAALLRWIGSDSDLEARVQTLTTLQNLGGDSALAMAAGLKSSDATARRNLCIALGEAGAKGAIAQLDEIAQYDSDTVARDRAAEALAKLGSSPSGAAADSLVAAAREFLAGASAPADAGASRVYFWNGRRIMDREVTPALFGPANAKLLAEQALTHEPGHAEAQKVLIEAYEGLALGLSGSGDDTGPAGWDGALDRVRDLLRAGGALSEPFAVEAPPKEELAGAAELLGSPDKRLRYKAALALAPEQASPEIVATLAAALSESAIRQVVVVSPDPEERNVLLAAAKSLGVVAVAAETGAQGLMRCKEAPVKDAVILRTTLSDVSVKRMIENLHRDARTSGLPVIVVAGEAERDQVAEQLGSSIVAVVPAPVTAAVLLPALAGAFEKAPLNDERMLADQFSRRAALTLAAIDGAALAPAAAALVGAVKREDEVRIPALEAIGDLGPAEAEVPVLGVFNEEGASPEVRRAAVYALRGVLARNPGRAETLNALEAAARGSDPALRSAACAALGAAVGFAPERRSRLLLDLSLPY